MGGMKGLGEPPPAISSQLPAQTHHKQLLNMQDRARMKDFTPALNMCTACSWAKQERQDSKVTWKPKNAEMQSHTSAQSHKAMAAHVT